MKIGITCYPTYGGSGVVATELGIELAERGHEVHFITYSPPFRLAGREAKIRYHEVSVTNYPLFEFPPYDLALATRMAEIADLYNLDLLHVHYAIPHSVSALLARQMSAARGRKLPFVTTLHGTDITLVGMDNSYLPVTKFAMEQSDGLTAISEYLRDLTIKEFGVTRPVEVIANFVNCDLYKPAGDDKQKKRNGFAREGEALLIHLSNFRPVKRTLDVMEIFRRVAAQLPARLLMVGDGPDRAACERFTQCHGLRSKVSFVGKQERVNELMALADLNLVPSELESFGLVALEAMACEVPTIATNVGGIPELIRHEETGLLFGVGEVGQMADGAVELLRNPAQLKAMGAAGRQFARKNFCASLVVPRYEQYYAQVVEAAR